MSNRRSRKSDSDPRQASGVKNRPTQAEINRQLRSWTPRRIASWSLMLGGVLIAAQHLVAHAGFRPLPFSMGWQDLLVGYPMAALLAIAGAILIDPRPRI
jgi:hypothetical protein